MNRRPAASGPRAPAVSDHALLRFLQRSGMDVEGVRTALSASLANAHGAAQTLGGGDHLILVDDMMYVVRGGVVTTAMPAGSIHDRARALCHRTDRGQQA